MKNKVSDSQMQIAYKAGDKSRKDFMSKDSCPYGAKSLNLRHQWLAGWHDADMGGYL
jgi:ribosome modulation factor